MSEKTKKKRVFLRVVLILLIILVFAVAVPITALYVQYSRLSYTPFEPIERQDEYVMPDYPELSPESGPTENIPEETQSAFPSADETSSDVISVETTQELVESMVSETDIVETEPESTKAPETAVVIIPETLPSILFTPPETDTSVVPPQDNVPTTPPPVMNPNNSFANTSNAISVYGHTPIYKVKQIDSNVTNILLLGTDSRDVAQDRGRSDTMIIVSYNKKTGEIKMISLLRDSLVPIEGYGWNRLNAAYAFDGVGLSINTINQIFGLDIQHFIVVDFNGAKNFIDQIGGIDLTLSEDEANFIGVPYSSGPIHLDGKAALNHMRNRKIGNDFGRTERQREVIVAVFNKILSEKSLPEILEIIQNGMRMVKTNIPAATLTSLAASIVGKTGNISVQLQNVPYTDAFRPAWYNNMEILSFDIQSTGERMRKFLYN